MELKDCLVCENITVLQALEQLDTIGRKVLFVQREERLVATLTDGDIRRWILKQGSLNAAINSVANYKPKYVYMDQRSEAKKLMRQYSVEAMPVLDSDGRILSILYWDEAEVLHKKKALDIPVVMMAGGLGTRLYPYTKVLPKPLIPIGDIPISEHIINQFCTFGCREYYLIVNHKKNMIKAYFNEIDKNYDIYYVDEEKPLGTGGGLSLLKGKISTTFILTNCDILIREDISKIYEYHKKEKQVITMVCSLKNFSIPYGVVDIGKKGEIAEMREKPQISFFTNTGCYIVEPEVIEELEKDVAIGFPDIIERYKNCGKKVGVYPISENAWLDMGQFEEMERMRDQMGEQ